MDLVQKWDPEWRKTVWTTELWSLEHCSPIKTLIWVPATWRVKINLTLSNGQWISSVLDTKVQIRADDNSDHYLVKTPQHTQDQVKTETAWMWSASKLWSRKQKEKLENTEEKLWGQQKMAYVNSAEKVKQLTGKRNRQTAEGAAEE